MIIVRFSIREIFSRKARRRETGKGEPLMTVWPQSLMDDPGAPVAMKIATVYRCVRLLSEAVANLPLHRLRRTPEGIFEPYDRGREWWLLEVQPNEEQNAFDFWRAAVCDILLEGAAYLLPQWSPADGHLERLLHLGRNTVGYDRCNRLYTVNDTERGVTGTFTEEEIVVLRGFTPRRDMGEGITRFMDICSRIASAGDREARKRFETGGGLKGFITNESGVFGMGEYQDEALDSIVSRLLSLSNKGQTLFAMPGKAQFHATSANSADMQFLEQRKFTVREICRFFGVHPSFVFDDTSNNYKSAEMANVAFLSNTLNPMLRQIETELRRKLLTVEEARTNRYEFDREALYACDLESRMAYQEKRIATGIDTPNESRRKFGRAPVQGGDALLVSANLKTLAELTAQSQTTANNE